MFGHSMEDGALTMCLVLAADSWQRAVMEGRLRSLCWAGVWVGLGFQAKMLQAWMILPALGIGYLLAAPGGLIRRLRQLGVAGLVMLAVSLSWIALYTFTPAADRPYVDGSTNNSAVAMVFGYNGVERFGISFPGSVASFGGGGGGGPVGRVGRRRRARGAGAAVQRGRVPRPLGRVDEADQQPVRPGDRLAVPARDAGADSRAGVAGAGQAHRSGARGAGDVGRVAGYVRRHLQRDVEHPAHRLHGLAGAAAGRPVRRGDRAVLALVPGRELGRVAAAGGGGRGAGLGLLPVVGVPRVPALGAAGGDRLGVVAVVVMVAGRLSRRARGAVVGAGLAVGVAAMLAAPTAWAASVLDSRYAGSSFDASAGPAGGFGPGGGGAAGAAGGGGFRPGACPGAHGRLPWERRSAPGEPWRRLPAAVRRAAGSPAVAVSGVPVNGRFRRGRRPGGAGGPGGGIFGSTSLSASQQQLYRYVSAHRDGAGYLLAVSSWSEASAYILATGQEVMPMGGFSGSVPEPTLARVRQLVATGQLRFFLLGGTGGFGGPGRGGAGGTAAQVTSWVESACAAVPAADYGGASGSAETLYACGSRG